MAHLHQNITCFYLDATEITCEIGENNVTYIREDADFFATGSVDFYVYIAVCMILVCLGGVFSGLTLGYLSLDMMSLKVIAIAGTHQEQHYARKIIPLVRNHHLLLVTLLLCNAGVMEALPLFLDRLVPTVYAIIISVSMVLVFGEILPQAACSKYGLAIGAHMFWFVASLMVILLPITYPISKALDYILGKDHYSYFRRSELSAMLDMHTTDSSHEGTLELSEAIMMQGIIRLKDLTCKDIMTDTKIMYMISSEQRMHKEIKAEIFQAGHSRVPVFNGSRDTVDWVLNVKVLLAETPTDTLMAKDIKLQKIPRLSMDTPLFNALQILLNDSTHMAAVSSEASAEVRGFLTLTDILDEMTMGEIFEEVEVYEDDANVTNIGEHDDPDFSSYIEISRRSQKIRRSRQRRMHHQPGDKAKESSEPREIRRSVRLRKDSMVFKDEYVPREVVTDPGFLGTIELGEHMPLLAHTTI